MKSIMRNGFTSLLIAAVAVGLYAAKGWNPTTALFPRVIGFPMLALLTAILVVDITRGRRQKENGETADAGGTEFSAETRRTAIYLGWLIGFGVLIWAIGIVYSIPIYVFGYLKIVGKYGWLKSGIYAAAAVAVIILLFEYAFQIAWPEGALLSILNSGN
jgi:hypothetical protein